MAGTLTQMSFATASGLLDVNLAAIGRNYQAMRAKTKAAVAGIVKADAYGLGAEPVFRTLIGQGCEEFFVATPDEALALRALNAKVKIYVLGGLYHGAEDSYLTHNIIPVLNSPEMIGRWIKTCARHGTRPHGTIHIDTGMNRLGLRPEDLEDISGLTVDLVMTHFACSDEKGHAMNDAQAAAFARAAAYFPEARKSLCNSSGLFRNEAWHHDLVRPGYALYGGNPIPETDNPMEPVAALKTRILQIRTARKGESAGYGAHYTFDRNTALAVVALGYADGFFRAASNQAALYWDGQPCPVRGRVSMDLVIADIGHLENRPVAGDWMEVLGPHQDVDALARSCGTIGYEILTSFGPRYHRQYSR